MARVKVNINLKKTAKKLFANPKIFEKVGRFSIKRIKTVTRDGFSMVTGFKKRLPDLTENSKLRRELLAIINKGAHKDFDPDKSNLTFTGGLLNSLKFTLKKRRFGIGFIIKIFPDAGKRRKRLIGLRGKPLEQKDNLEINRDLEKRGFGFLGMDKEGESKIREMLTNALKRELRRLRRR